MHGSPGGGNTIRASVLLGELALLLGALLALLVWWPAAWWAWAILAPAAAARRAGVPLRELAGPLRLRRTLLVVLLLGVLSLPFLGLLAWVAGGWAAPPWPGLGGMLSLAGAAAAEEWFFRGWLQARLGRRWPRAALVLAAAAFALAHVPGWGPAAALVFLPGLALGLAREWSGALFAPILLHLAWNLWASGLPGAGP